MSLSYGDCRVFWIRFIKTDGFCIDILSFIILGVIVSSFLAPTIQLRRRSLNIVKTGLAKKEK
jgi:hypothetical protein